MISFFLNCVSAFMTPLNVPTTPYIIITSGKMLCIQNQYLQSKHYLVFFYDTIYIFF